MILLSNVYKNFKNIFLIENVIYFLFHKDYNYVINLINSK